MELIEKAAEECNRLNYSVAICLLEEAIRLKPDDAMAHYCLSQMYLMVGEYRKGFFEFEWRFKLEDELNTWYKNTYDWSKSWDGSPLQDRTLLVFCEQGIGDAIQFLRYIKYIEGDVVVHAHKPLAPLLNEKTIVADIGTDEYKDFPSYDCVCSSMSLPYLLNDYHLNGSPYIFRSDRSHPKQKRRIGIVWGGNRERSSEDDVRTARSIPLKHFKELSNLGDSVYGLQVQPRPDLGDASWLCNLADEISDLRDTADIMLGMDLIITCDTVVAHLAGALGCPCWVLLNYFSDWRWGVSDTTPWYDSIRLFRQREPGNWETVFEEVDLTLKEML